MDLLSGLRKQGLWTLRGLMLLVLVAVPVVGAATPPDAETLRKLTAVAEQGSATAQYHVGMFHNNGIGTAKDPRTAFRWFERAAAGGDALGRYKVGCYYAGQFPGAVEVDEAKALAAKTAAAEAGYSLAQGDVGNGHAQKGDWPQAVKWWSAATAQGYAQAAYNLANAYQRGQGVPKDPVKALTNMLIAERLIPEPTRSRLAPRVESIRSTASPEQIAQARSAAAAWQANPSPLTLRAQRGMREVEDLVR
jgi:TPR repeat protein